MHGSKNGGGCQADNSLSNAAENRSGLDLAELIPPILEVGKFCLALVSPVADYEASTKTQCNSTGHELIPLDELKGRLERI